MDTKKKVEVPDQMPRDEPKGKKINGKYVNPFKMKESKAQI